MKISIWLATLATLAGGPALAQNAYIPKVYSNNVAVVDTQTNAVIGTIPVGNEPVGVAVTPNGGTVYITNYQSGTISAIDTATNSVIATITGLGDPFGIAVSPDGSTVYVANFIDGTVSVIATATDTVTATIPGFSQPVAFGVFIGPPPVLATPPSGTACNGCSTAPSRAR